MAKQKTTSALGKLGLKGQKAFKKNRDKTVEYDTAGDLPEGIDGGVAQLVACHFGETKEGDNKGEPFFFAAGVFAKLFFKLGYITPY